MTNPTANATTATFSHTKPAPTRSGFENRRSARKPHRSTAQLQLYPPGRHPHPIDVTVVDYSGTGIGIEHCEGLLVGQMFIVREPLVTSGKTCLYTVVRSDKRKEGHYSIGMHVGNQLGDELEMFSSPATSSTSRFAKIGFASFVLCGLIAVAAWTLFKS